MKKLYKRLNFAMALALVTIIGCGCAKKPDKSQIVARINNYQLTSADFKQEAGMNIQGAPKELILQDIITKELLLQEAQRMNLDKNKHFMKEIENYWKQALIKSLISIKGDEFLAMTKINDEEVKAVYSRVSQEAGEKNKPYEKLYLQIRRELKMIKAQALLDDWIKGLKKTADIKIYGEVFNSIKFRDRDKQGGSLDEK